MDKTKQICFCVCMVCLAISVAVGLIAIWGNVDPDTLWKCFLSIALLFLASAGVGAASKLLDKETKQ